MTSPGFSDHFSGVAGDYAAFRPEYPPTLFDWLARVAPGRELAVDMATGTGQAARGLANHFRTVLALDASAAQIANARIGGGIQYRVAPAEDPGLGAIGADVIVVAQALHWFDREAFFEKAREILRSGGVLAAWTYQLHRFDDERLDSRIRSFYRDTLGEFWPPERALVDAGYAGIEWPFPEIDTPRVEIKRDLSLEDLAGYLGTWSAVIRYRGSRGSDPLPELINSLRPHWGPGTRTAVWPLAIRAGRKPSAAG